MDRIWLPEHCTPSNLHFIFIKALMLHKERGFLPLENKIPSRVHILAIPTFELLLVTLRTLLVEKFTFQS